MSELGCIEVIQLQLKLVLLFGQQKLVPMMREENERQAGAKMTGS